MVQRIYLSCLEAEQLAKYMNHIDDCRRKSEYKFLPFPIRHDNPYYGDLFYVRIFGSLSTERQIFAICRNCSRHFKITTSRDFEPQDLMPTETLSADQVWFNPDGNIYIEVDIFDISEVTTA
jgi:hypothetical protein